MPPPRACFCQRETRDSGWGEPGSARRCPPAPTARSAASSPGDDFPLGPACRTGSQVPGPRSLPPVGAGCAAALGPFVLLLRAPFDTAARYRSRALGKLRSVPPLPAGNRARAAPGLRSAPSRALGRKKEPSRTHGSRPGRGPVLARSTAGAERSAAVRRSPLPTPQGLVRPQGRGFAGETRVCCAAALWLRGSGRGRGSTRAGMRNIPDPPSPDPRSRSGPSSPGLLRAGLRGAEVGWPWGKKRPCMVIFYFVNKCKLCVGPGRVRPAGRCARRGPGVIYGGERRSYVFSVIQLLFN